MKAGILHEYGGVPVYQDFPEPKAPAANEPGILVSPLASSVKQLDRTVASGKHYTKYKEVPSAMGIDGVVELADGSRAFAEGITGLMAEKAIVEKDSLVPMPEGLSLSLAASLPNALMGSDMALLERGQIKKGDVVLVNGATGRTGSLAVQMAKFRGASKVIAIGRNQERLDDLMTMGADQIISLDNSDRDVMAAIAEAYRETPFDIILDYLWNKPTELVLSAMAQVKVTKQVRFVTIGNMAGPTISLLSQILRGHDIVILGSGIGASSPEVIRNYMKKNLLEIFAYAAEGKIHLPVHEYSLERITEAWNRPQAVIFMRPELIEEEAE